MNIMENHQSQAHVAIAKAIKKGLIIRPQNCELCGIDGEKRYKKYRENNNNNYKFIVAHHWAGYDKKNWLNVWWICRSCNTRLGKRHDGSLSKGDAKTYVYGDAWRKVYSNQLREAKAA